MTDFIHGFTLGLSLPNIEPDFNLCWKNAVIVFNNLKSAIEDFNGTTVVNYTDGLNQLNQVYQQLNQTITPCASTYQDINDLSGLIGITITAIQTGKTTVVIGSCVSINGRNILTQLTDLLKSANNSDWVNIGQYLGQIVQILSSK